MLNQVTDRRHDRTELEPSDIYQGFYHVYCSYAKGHKLAVVDLYDLADSLPHGSGIDGNWYIQVRVNGAIGVTGEYHAMDEWGGYCGWRSFRFAIARVKANQFNLLKGPCEGQVQITQRKGDVVLTSFRGGGDAGDYLYETVSYSIEKLLSHGSDTVSLEVARSMGYRN